MRTMPRTPTKSGSLLGAFLLLAATGCANLADADRAMSISQLADQLQSVDVVFVGELHGNDVGHTQQLLLLQELHRRHPNIVLALEMFERDVQEHVDRWLAGDLSDEEFATSARAWPNYATDYRPMLEYARTHKIHVVASNVPRRIAAEVAKGIDPAAIDSPHAAAETTAPMNAYWRAFRSMIGDSHGDIDLKAYYRAQCLKDDTMAESIARVLRGSPDTLVLHINGTGHTTRRLGIVPRLERRVPDVKVAVVSMEEFGNIRRTGKHDYELLVAPQPSREVTTDRASDSRVTTAAR